MRRKYLVSPRQYPLVITTGRILPGATVGVNYHQAFNAVGGSGVYTWAVLAQSGTNTWNIFPNGEITGTPINGTEVDNFTIQVTDSVGNIAIGQFSIAIAGSGVSQIKFHPGHQLAQENTGPGSIYSLTYNSNRDPNRAQLSALIETPGNSVLPDQIRAIALNLTWKMMESDTQGVYDGFNRGGVGAGGGTGTVSEAAGFTYINDILKMCRNKMVERQSRGISVANSFLGISITPDQEGGGDPGNTSAGGVKMPSYVKGITNCVWNTGSGWAPRYCLSAAQNPIIARDAAYMAHFDNDPNFEMYCVCRGGTDPGSLNVTEANYSNTKWQQMWINMVNGVAPSSTKTLMRVSADWLNGWDGANSQMYFVPLLEAMKAKAALGHPIAAGGPDCFSVRTNALGGSWTYVREFEQVLHGYSSTDGGTTWTQNAHNYYADNLFAIILDCQDPEMGQKENTGGSPPNGNPVYANGGAWQTGQSTASVFTSCINEGAHYIEWWPKQYVLDGTKTQLMWQNSTASHTGETSTPGHFALDVWGLLTGDTAHGAPAVKPLGPPLNQTNPVGFTRG